jgi:ABC-type transport system substrate-binding protein
LVDMSSYSVKATRAFAIMMVAAFVVGGVPAAMDEPAEENAAAAELLVRCGWLSDVLVWNPMNLEMVEDYVAAYLIYSPLFTYDEDWNELVGDLAREWESTVMDNGTPGDESDDYVVANIKITENAYWRGKDNLDDTSHPVTAEDVKFTYEMIIEEDAGAWPLYLEGIEEINVLGTYELEIVTNKVKAVLFDDLTGPLIVPKYIWETYKTNPCTKTMQPDQLVGCGPMVFDSMLESAWWKFITAPNYHMATDFGEDADIDIDGALFTMHGSATELTMAMNAGNEDAIVLTGEPNLYLNTLSDSVVKQAVQENGITDVALNAIPFENRTQTYGNGFELLVDPILREAILMCMNKTFINEGIMCNLSTPANSVVQPGYWHLNVTPEIPFDPAGAKALLLANGYANLDSDDWLECAVTDSTDWRSEYYGVELSGIRCEAPATDPSYFLVAEAWEGWAEDAGIGLEAAQRSEGIMVSQAWYKADYDIWVWHWGWGPEPLSTLGVWLTRTMEPGGDNCEMPMGPIVDGEYVDYVNVELGLDLTCDYPGSIYDQVWEIASRTMDQEERREYVYLLQQWVYDSMCEYPPYYDLGLYAYSESTFTGWGDWEAHNGLAFTNGLPWLWQNLEPAANTPPRVSIGLSPSYDVLVDEPEIFTIEVYDAEGDQIWVNWTFGDGSPMVSNHTTTDTSETPITFVQSHTYTTEEMGLELNLSITDGLPGHLFRITAEVNVVGELDAVPLISLVSSDPSGTAYVGQEVTWTATFQDAEAEELKVTWKWGDDTYDVVDLTPAAVGQAVVDERTHAWEEVGTYDVVVSVWDGYGDEDGSHNQSTGATDNRMEIIENTEPVAPLVAGISTIENVWTPCLAVTSDADADVLTVTWEWDDGTFNTTYHDTSGAQGAPVMSSVMHMWDTSGSYSVTVWVDDGEEGHNVSTEVTAEVAAAGAEVGPSSLLVVADPTPAIVDGTTVLTVSAFDANGDAIAFTIDFGDDSDLAFDDSSEASTGIQTVYFEHVYEEVGDVVITLYADDGTTNSSDTFDLEVVEPVGNSPPSVTLQTSYSAVYNTTFTITPIGVNDVDGDEVEVWYDWGDDSAMTAGDPDNGYRASHSYTSVGDLTISVYADDGTGLDGHNVTKTATVEVREANYKPKFTTVVKVPSKNEYGPDEVIAFNITVYDPEGDAITVTIDFGDGSAVESRDLEAAGPKVNVSTSFEHAYAEEGDYTVTIVIKDAYDHPTSWNSRTVEVTVIDTSKSNVLLYAGIGLLVILAVVAAILLMKRKKGGAELEEAGGMEGMAPPEEPPPADAPKEPSS